MPDELEIAIAQVRDVGEVAGQQVVDADHREAAIEQRFRKVRSDETGGAGDDYAWHVRPWSVSWVGESVARRGWGRTTRISVSHMILMSSVTDQFSM